MKKLFLLFFVLFSALFTYACNAEDQDEDGEKDVLDILETELTLEEGKTYTFETIKEVLIVSSDEEVVSVDQDTLTITAIKEGSSIVTISLKNDADVTKNVVVTVTAKEIEETIISDEAIYEWLCSIYKDKVIDGDIVLHEYYKDTEIMLFYSLEHKTYLSNSGKYTAPLLDLKSYIYYSYDLEITDENGETRIETYDHKIPFILKGYGNEAMGTALDLEKNLPEEISESYQLPVEYSLYAADIKWYYNGVELVNGLFVVDEDLDESFTATIKAVITAKGNTVEEEYSIFVSHLSIPEKILAVRDELVNRYSNQSIENDVTLIYKDDTFGAKIQWKSWAPHIISDRGKYIQPLQDSVINLQATVTLQGELNMFDIPLNVKGLNPVGIENKVQAFLDRIALNEIKNQKFSLYGWETEADGFDGNYTNVPTYNYGYIFFYTTDDIKLTEDIIPLSHAGRPGTIRQSTEFITIHNTGMAHPQSTAEYLNTYIHTDVTREASWHYSVDDKEAYQHLPLNEVGWHAGDGSTYPGIHYNDTYHKWCINGGNKYSIGIENCVYKGIDYNTQMRTLAKLVANLLIDFNLTTTDIRQHYDFSGKNCPQVLRQSGRWAEQLELIELVYYAKTELAGIEFEWTSLNPEVLDNTGKVAVTRSLDEITVSYKVKVTGQGLNKEYQFESLLKAIEFTVESEGNDK